MYTEYSVFYATLDSGFTGKLLVLFVGINQGQHTMDGMDSAVSSLLPPSHTRGVK
jgi:hypothetical protein